MCYVLKSKEPHVFGEEEERQVSGLSVSYLIFHVTAYEQDEPREKLASRERMGKSRCSSTYRKDRWEPSQSSDQGEVMGSRKRVTKAKEGPLEPWGGMGI